MMDQLVEDLRTGLTGRYEIDGELGSGGMAVVFRAHDIKHDRDVAIKVLRPELAVSIGADRFLREIRITAKLSHPHILPLYDSGEANGQLYYVMPLVTGETLADRLRREKQLPLEETIRIARQVASALHYAHQYGLIHRDIKPENILFSDDHAVVGDFGVGTAISAAGGDKLTETGMAVGTPLYMSPEQAAASPDLDPRSDIYSLGCVLYEMIVGEAPFSGPTPQAVMARHSLESVPKPRIVRPAIPNQLEAVVLKALEKTPADRYRTASEFSEALRLVSTDSGQISAIDVQRPRSGIQKKRTMRNVALAALGIVVFGLGAWILTSMGGEPVPSGDTGLDPSRLAVLYFDDLSRDQSYAHVADGLTEDLIADLGTVRALDVISANGVFPYRGSAVSRDSISRALDAGTLIEGSVEDVADGLRVTVQLVDGVSGVEFKRQGIVMPATDLLTLRDSVVEEASTFLRERLGDEIRARRQQDATQNVAAWISLQRAERNMQTAQELIGHDQILDAWTAYGVADSLLATAERLDPSWIEPIVQRSDVAYQRARLSFGDPREADELITIGLGHAERALDRQPRHAGALEMRGTLRYVRWLLRLVTDPEEAGQLLTAAQRDLEGAVDADPTRASAYSTLSHLHSQKPDWVASNLAARRAYEEDAYLRVADQILYRLFTSSYDLEYHTEAVRWCEEGARRFPHLWRFTECQLWLMTSRARDPDPNEAWRLYTILEEETPPDAPLLRQKALMAVAAVVARAGDADSALAVAERARANPEIDPERELLVWEAMVHVMRDDHERAFATLSTYVSANPDHRFTEEENIHWWWRPIQDDPRFQALLAPSTH